MRSYSSAVIAALQSGKLVERGLLLIDLPSGKYGFWTGLGSISVSGQVYIGAGQLIEVDAISSATDLSASALVFKLTAIANSALTPDVLATIEQEQYRQRPVTLSTLYTHVDTRDVLGVERVYRGYIDRFMHTLQADGGAVLEMHCESKSLDHSRTGYRTRADLDQKKIDGNDGFFEHVAVAANQEMVWGRNANKPQKGLGQLGIFQ